MSDTPRTDAEPKHRQMAVIPNGARVLEFVSAEYARGLERELASLTEWRNARLALDSLDEFDDPHNFQAAKRRLAKK